MTRRRFFASFLLGRSPPPITIVGGSRRERCVVGVGWASVVARGTRATPVAWGMPDQPGSKRASRRAPMALRSARLAAADFRNGRRRCPHALPAALHNPARRLIALGSRRKSYIPAVTAQERLLSYTKTAPTGEGPASPVPPPAVLDLPEGLGGFVAVAVPARAGFFRDAGNLRTQEFANILWP